MNKFFGQHNTTSSEEVVQTALQVFEEAIETLERVKNLNPKSSTRDALDFLRSQRTALENCISTEQPSIDPSSTV